MNKRIENIEDNFDEVPKFVENVFKNLLDEPTKSIGTTLKNFWDIIIGDKVDYYAKKGKLSYALKIAEYAEEINEAMKKIAEKNRKTPNIQVLGNTLEDSKYCLDSIEIRQMFANLVAASCDITKEEVLNPAFSNVIKQLSVDDAIVLRHMHRLIEEENNKFPVVDIRKIDEEQIVENVHGKFTMKVVCDNQIFNIRTQQTLQELSVGIRAYENISIIGYEAKCYFPDNISSLLENLERLRLISIREREIVSCDDCYSSIENSDFVYNLLKECPFNFPHINNYYYFEKKYFCFTQFGKNFMEVCD